MEFQVLMSVMDQHDFSIVKKSNLKANAIMINQSDTFSYNSYQSGNYKYQMFTFNEKGIGKSRNKALMFSDADICLIADDDITYVDDFSEVIIKKFDENPSADIIIFDVDILENNGYRKFHNKNEKINKLNFMKHGGPKIAFKRKAILKKNISFSLMFGGGSKYGSGEDSLFLKSSLDKGLKIISVSDNIGEIDNRESTWFGGFNDKYLYDRGALFKAMYPRIWLLIALQFTMRHFNKFNKKTKIEILKLLIKGAKEY